MPEFGFNGIGDLIPGQGYQIKMMTSDEIITLTIYGEFLKPELNPINLDSGWNIIGYIRTDNISAVDVFSDINQQGNLIIVKNYLGGAYLPEFGFNGVGYFHPGQGYQVKVNNDCTLWYLPINETY